MKVVVAAVPGSGKSTIMNLVRKSMPNVKIVNVGDMIAEAAMKDLGIKDRDQLRKKLRIYEQRKYQEIAAKKIAKMKGDVVIDTHSAVKTPHGFFPGLSETPVHILNPDAIVVIEYDPREIIRRRNGDGSRRRDHEDAETIEEHQRASRYFAFGAAQHADASVKLLNLRFRQKSRFEHAEIAAGEIVKLFKLQHKL